MTVATVITEGYGSFGNANFVITEGYGNYAAAATAESFSGGFYHYGRRPPSREEIRRQREELGIIPKASIVIDAVAARQAQDLRLDEQQRFEELERELQLEGIQSNIRHLEALNQQRERLIDAEIEKLLNLKFQQDFNARLLILLAACL